MVTQSNVFKCNYAMLAHPICSIWGQWDSALPNAIIPSVPIRQSPKLQHET